MGIPIDHRPDVIVCGSCVVDLPCLSIELASPIGKDQTHPIEPIVPTCGGITCNTGIALRRLGISSGVLTYVGDDHWGEIIRRDLATEGVDTTHLITHPTAPTTAVALLVDHDGERSFLAPGITTATKSIDAPFVLDRLDSIRSAKWFVAGYFSRMPALEPDLAECMAAIRATGCKTALDVGGDGGTWENIAPVLPHLDLYLPSLHEAQFQTGLLAPREILTKYRDAGAPGIIGLTMGANGAIVLGPDGDPREVPAAVPPSPVIDTTGAGDCFLAGFLAGLIRGLPLSGAATLAAETGAAATTARGGYAGIR